MDPQDYLQPDFDPSSLTVPKLRNVLLIEDVDYPQSAKKAVLVDLFNQHITPKAARLRDIRTRVHASAHGMVDAAPPRDDFDPSSARRHTASRKSARGAVDTTEDGEEQDRTRTRRKSIVRGRTSELEMPYAEKGPVKSTCSPRKSASRKSTLPKAKPFVSDEDTEGSTDGVFSNYNPFQSGSPPAPSEKDRRKTIAMPIPEKRRSSISKRRTDFGPQKLEDDYTYTPPVDDFPHKLRSEPPYLEPHREPELCIKQEEAEEELMPGEDFVPEEAEEVAIENATVQPTRRHRGLAARSRSTSLWAIVTALLVGYFAWWRKQKIEAGFCGVGGFDMDNSERESWANILRPECEPCPAYAICMPDLELQCEDDYIEIPHPMSLNGIIPLPPSCQPDTEKERRITVLADEAINVMRERNAEERCKRAYIKGEFELPAGSSQDDLRQVLYDRKSASLSDREFAELWRHAIEDVAHRGEVETHTGSNGTVYLKSTSLAGVPIGCAVRLAILGSMARHRVELAGITIAILAALKVRSTLVRGQAYQQQVTRLVCIALARLAQAGERGIAVAHLRDQVLQHEFDPVKRTTLWQGVERVVEMNSNVRTGEREVMGEIMRVWMWIGGHFLEDTANADDLRDEN